MESPARIQEAHPLKQGLKLGVRDSVSVGYDIQEAHPLKQGLKPLNAGQSATITFIQEAHPLKQGLKPATQAEYDAWVAFKRRIH